MELNFKSIVSMVSKMIDPIKRNIQLTIGRCVLEAIDDAKGMQVVKVSLLADEVQEMERIQNYGFTSNPFAESAEGVAVFVGGNRDHGICIALDDRTFRLKNLGAGQVALYDSTGAKVLMGNDGKITIASAIEVDIGNPATLEKVLKGETFQALFNAHVHVGNLGVLTSPPTMPSLPIDLSLSVKTGL